MSTTFLKKLSCSRLFCNSLDIVLHTADRADSLSQHLSGQYVTPYLNGYLLLLVMR